MTRELITRGSHLFSMANIETSPSYPCGDSPFAHRTSSFKEQTSVAFAALWLCVHIRWELSGIQGSWRKPITEISTVSNWESTEILLGSEVASVFPHAPFMLKFSLWGFLVKTIPQTAGEEPEASEIMCKLKLPQSTSDLEGTSGFYGELFFFWRFLISSQTLQSRARTYIPWLSLKSQVLSITMNIAD